MKQQSYHLLLSNRTLLHCYLVEYCYTHLYRTTRLREEEKKEHTFIIRSNICERFFIQKERKISSVL